MGQSRMSQASYQQAGIEIQDKVRFGELQGAMARTFSPESIEKFLKKLENKSLSIRNFEKVLSKQVFEQLDETLGRSGQKSADLYEALPMSDRGQAREFYLTALEAVDQKLREKYSKLYRYY
jgi:hypothetical protein